MQPHNPILRGMHPDPSICRVGGTYYLATSTFEYLPGIPVHTSTDLVQWSLAGHAIERPEQFDFSAVADSRGMFAPTIRHHDGLFYIACTQMNEGGGSFYVTAADVAGPWSDPVMLPEARGIDPSLFFHEGRAWWIGCREVAEQQFDGETEVWMRELDLERGELVGPERVIWTRTQARAVWAEAPHLYRRGDWFYLVTAEGGTAFEHSVMVARSASVEGPYLPCPRNPVLTHRHLGHCVPVQNVGHADFVEDVEGQWWLVALATRPIEGHHVLGRETHLARVDWEDDWPVVNPGRGLLDAPVERAAECGSDGAPALADFLSVRGGPGFARAEATGIRLHSTGSALDSPRPVAALLRRLSSTESSVEIVLDDVAPDATAGLVLRQSSSTHVRIDLVRSGAALVAALVARDGEDSTLGTAELPLGPVALRADLGAGEIAWSAGAAGDSPVGLGTTPLSALSTETAGGFVGTTFGPYAAGPEGAGVLFVSWSQKDRA